MDSAGGDKAEEPQMSRSGVQTLGDFIPIYIPTVQEEPMEEPPLEKKKRFLDFLRARPSGDRFLNSGVFRRRFRVPFVRKINWNSLLKSGKEWVREPINMAFFLWLAAVFACLFLFLLLISGMFNGVISESSRRKKWTEVVNQVLNALFTIFCLYEHPKLAHHLDHSPRNERAHMAIVIVLLHIACFSQYVLCGLYWGFNRSNRPDIGIDVALAVGIGAPIVAAVHALYGPLGRKAKSVGAEEELQLQETPPPPVTGKTVRLHKRVVVTRPEWIGGLFDCWDDMVVAYLSFFCTICVFGWNMERLGFGNMYVHIATFALVIVAPFLVFNAAALNIDNDVIREMMAISGIVLCFLGLVYGGFWRTQMRRRFKLPPSTFCCGFPNITDCFQWLFCWSCSLAQEVRTANFYDIADDGFFSKNPPPGSAVEGGDGGGGNRIHSIPISELPELLKEPVVELPQRSFSSPARISDVLIPMWSHPARVADCNQAGDGSLSPPRPPTMIHAEGQRRCLQRSESLSCPPRE
ncbi:unnamed protein product [Spirodela intermedia]|uniref:Uncharacterized protein n=1 Tax=Spirodela intermedia TaxID=51605 RepID=A0A7I8JIN7_SPIIN|nr:unnamed protein product [Spirodela intermedia]CAA6669282.1 unnamed protein product [Spirodela intermedia]